jgi:ATP-dependent Clp protease, protease subunit
MKTSHKLVAVAAILVGLYFFPFSSFIGTSSDQDVVVLSKSNTITLNGEIDGETAATVIAQAKAFPANGFMKRKPIYLFLNTPGGSIQTGLEMIEALNGLGRPVETVTLFAASMGFQVVQNLGTRFILRNGILMSHRAQGQFSGYFGGKQGSQIDKRYSFWHDRLEELDLQTVKRTNGKQTLETYQAAYADELWLTGQQAIAGGYADRIVTLRCDSSLNGVTTHSVEFLGAKVLYDLDNCPINTNPMNVRVSFPEEKVTPGPARVAEVKAKFTEDYQEKQRAVLPMY